MKRPFSFRSSENRRAQAGGSVDLQVRAEREAQRQRLEVFLTSRDAASGLTASQLPAGDGSGDRVAAVIASAGAVADFADRAVAIVVDQYQPAVACREGCNYCCCKPGVLVTVPELLRLLDAIGQRFSEDEKSALVLRAGRYASQIAGSRFDDATNESVPCPLLVDGRCSVYDVRPLACRGYNSTSADACRAAHADATRLVPIFSVLKDVTDGAAVGVSQSLRRAGFNDAMVDLGSALDLALTAESTFMDEILAGSLEFAGAENATWAEELWAKVAMTARQLGVSVR